MPTAPQRIILLALIARSTALASAQQRTMLARAAMSSAGRRPTAKARPRSLTRKAKGDQPRIHQRKSDDDLLRGRTQCRQDDGPLIAKEWLHKSPFNDQRLSWAGGDACRRLHFNCDTMGLRYPSMGWTSPILHRRYWR
jgi:hypothetical protein